MPETMVLQIFAVAFVVAVCVGALARRGQRDLRDKLGDLERKLDYLAKKTGVKFDPQALLIPTVRRLAKDGQVIQAIAMYRRETGLGLRASKDAVEKIMREP